MPIYQYQCTECGHGLEALQKMSDPKLTDCPACETPALKKQVTAAAFKLKGTGWYETDFKNSGKKPETAAKKDDVKSDVASADKKADTSTAQKAASSAAK